MAANEVQHGPVSRHVVENVKRLRDDKGWSFPRLSEELAKVGRPILATGLHRLENGRRRVDVDDLVGLALALGVTPMTLLLPPVSQGEIELTGTESAEADAVWNWMIGRTPLHQPQEDDGGYARLGFLRRSWPPGMVKYSQLDPAGLEGWAKVEVSSGRPKAARRSLEKASRLQAERGNHDEARRLLEIARSLDEAGD